MDVFPVQFGYRPGRVHELDQIFIFLVTLPIKLVQFLGRVLRKLTARLADGGERRRVQAVERQVGDMGTKNQEDSATAAEPALAPEDPELKDKIRRAAEERFLLIGARSESRKPSKRPAVKTSAAARNTTDARTNLRDWS